MYLSNTSLAASSAPVDTHGSKLSLKIWNLSKSERVCKGGLSDYQQSYLWYGDPNVKLLDFLTTSNPIYGMVIQM
jgi:hypothetical protein